MAQPSIVFVYNADSGLFNTVTDIAHKIFSPSTYSCNLCAITHSHFSMRDEWRAFIENLDCDCEYLHKDEYEKQYASTSQPLPAIFNKQENKISLLISADQINQCQSMDELKTLISNAITEKAVTSI